MLIKLLLIAVISFTSSEPDVEAIVQQLGADEWHARQAAQEKLVQLGDDARAALERAALESSDPEVRSRSEAALAQIAENRRIGASLITIRGQDMTLGEVVRQLSEQCGATIELYPPPEAQRADGQRVSLDIEREPFWTAMRQITEKTGLTLQQWDNTGPKLVQGAGGGGGVGGPGEGVSVVSGAFLISATRILHSRAVELSMGNNVSEDFSVQLHARAEPKLRLLRASYVPRLQDVRDERGNSLLPQDGAVEQASLAPAPQGAWQLNVRLNPVPDMGRRIAVLRGSIDVSLQTASEQVEISADDAARTDGGGGGSVTRVAGGVQFHVKELRRSPGGDGYVLHITARPDPGAQDADAAAAAADPEHFAQVVSLADLRLLDDRGEAFMRSGYSSSGNAQQTELTIEFSSRSWGRNHKLGEPAKLVWTVPTATRQITVPFEFRDLPIP